MSLKTRVSLDLPADLVSWLRAAGDDADMPLVRRVVALLNQARTADWKLNGPPLTLAGSASSGSLVEASPKLQHASGKPVITAKKTARWIIDWDSLAPTRRPSREEYDARGKPYPQPIPPVDTSDVVPRGCRYTPLPTGGMLVYSPRFGLGQDWGFDPDEQGEWDRGLPDIYLSTPEALAMVAERYRTIHAKHMRANPTLAAGVGHVLHHWLMDHQSLIHSYPDDGTAGWYGYRDACVDYDCG